MKQGLTRVATLLVIGLVVFAPAFAQEQSAGQEQGMPQMGPPPQMKQLEFLVGAWDVAMKMKMMPQDTAWIESNGVATYDYILGGAVLRSKYATSMMGMPVEGLELQGYNTDLNMWQVVWTDNMSGRLSMYVGGPEGDSTVLTGSEMYMGQQIETRIVSYNVTPTGFDWKMETSTDGGKTYQVTGTAVYTKQK